MLDRTQAPSFRPIESFVMPDDERSILSNGAEFIVVRAGVQPVLRIEFIYPAGMRFEAIPGLADFSIKMLQEGSAKHSSAQIARHLEQYGAFLDLAAGVDYATVTLHVLSRQLPHVLPLLLEIISAPLFPKSELDILKTIKQQSLQVKLEKNNVFASIKFREVLFGKDHPYGHTLYPDQIKNINSDQLESFFNAHLGLPSHIIIAGNPTEEDMMLVRNGIGSAIGTKPAFNLPAIETASNHEVIVEKKSSVQSSIRLGKKFVHKRDHDYNDLKVLNEVLGGYFGSRLMKNIREEKGFTYGIHSSMASLKDHAYLVIGTDVKKENTQETLDEIWKEVDLLKNEPIPEDELNTVKSYMAGSFISSLNTPFGLADKIKSNRLLNLNEDFNQRQFDAIRSVTAQRLQELANKYYQRDEFYTIIVGGQ